MAPRPVVAAISTSMEESRTWLKEHVQEPFMGKSAVSLQNPSNPLKVSGPLQHDRGTAWPLGRHCHGWSVLLQRKVRPAWSLWCFWTFLVRVYPCISMYIHHKPYTIQFDHGTDRSSGLAAWDRMEGSAWFAHAGVVCLADRYGAKGFATWLVGRYFCGVVRFAATKIALNQSLVSASKDGRYIFFLRLLQIVRQNIYIYMYKCR